MKGWIQLWYIVRIFVTISVCPQYNNFLKFVFKLENLEEMDTLLYTFNLPKWNQEAINHLNRTITSSETKEPTKKSPEPDGITVKS
jgi:hypothetical protein